MSKDPRVQGSKVTRVQGSMAQAAKLSMHPSSCISKIGMHANTFLIDSFKLWSIAGGAVRCLCFPFCSTCLVQSSRASFICFVRSFCTDVLTKLCEADRIGAVAYVGVFGAKYHWNVQAWPHSVPSPFGVVVGTWWGSKCVVGTFVWCCVCGVG